MTGRIPNRMNYLRSTQLRTVFLVYVFRHVTCLAIFVLFQQFKYKKVQLIQDIPAMTSSICAIVAFFFNI